jgi:maleylacetate reductase
VESFTYETLPSRVVFGQGTRHGLPAEAERLHLTRLLVLTTLALLRDRGAGLFAGAVMHTPVEVTEQALAAVEAARADGVVAVGGGSTTGLGKAIALRTDLPQIVIPTTYAGSEMTPILGETKAGVKTTQKSPKILPEVVLYDVDLTLSLPVPLSVTSGLNAVAHAVEALYAQDRNPITSLMAEDGIRAIARALPRIAADPADGAARSDALYGAWLCGACLGTVGMALHHKLCHTLGGTFDLPHAETHTAVLPHAVAYNAPAAPEAMERIARALAVAEAATGLFDLARGLGARMALRDLGMPEEGVARAADLAVQNPYWNPRPVDRAGISDLIARAFAGERPRTDSASLAA